MLRDSLGKDLAPKTGFRYRGREAGRLENFSDAVFGMAITLLLISTSPPTNFTQLKQFTYELFPFLACITLIVLIWYEHYTFFLRYGLKSSRMIVLNTLFLVIILFYVYPLKFLTRILLIGPAALLMGNKEVSDGVFNTIDGRDMPQLMIMYGIGAAAVFTVLCLMYRYALGKSDELGLNELERFDTRASIQSNMIMAGVPVMSVIVAFLLRNSFWAGPIAGFCYFLYTPLMFIFHRKVERQRKELVIKDG